MDGSDGRRTLRRLLVHPEERRPRFPWRLLLWLALVAVGSLAIGGAVRLLPPTETIAGEAGVVYASARTAVGVGGPAAVGIAAGYLLDRRTLADFGLGLDRQWWRDAGFGLALGLGLPTVVFAVELAAGWVRITRLFVTRDSGILPLAGLSPVVALVVLAGFFLVQATAEELLVRGYLLTNLAEGLAGYAGRRGALLVATVVTGSLFGILHWTNPGSSLLSTVNITLYGVLLGACYVLTGRLGVATGFHVAWNFALALSSFPVSGLEMGVALVGTAVTGPSLATGGEFGPEGGLLALCVLILGAGALYWWVRREYGVVALVEAVAVPDLR